MRKQKKPKYSLQQIKDIINLRDYELITDKYLGVMQKLTIRDKDGYLYYMTLNSFQVANPIKFHISNIYTIDNIKLWLKLNNKQFELIDDIYKGATKDLNWRCSVDGCNEYFKMSLDCITRTKILYGCPFCSNHRTGLSNCLAIKNPELAKEWHPTLNGELTPYDATSGSDKYVWWQCLINPKHQWNVRVAVRSNGSGCPYCSHNLPSEDYNLLVISPELCKEWNYEKNNKKPEEYTPKSGEKVWWICKEGHEWETTISHRNNGTCCPECNESKGEKECKRVFDLRNVYYISQKEFDGLIGLGGKNLSFDFYLPKYNLLIEYQGNYHDGTVPYQTKEEFAKQKEHDRRKKEYAISHKYNFLEIWYWDFDNIEQILDKELSNL